MKTKPSGGRKKVMKKALEGSLFPKEKKQEDERDVEEGEAHEEREGEAAKDVRSEGQEVRSKEPEARAEEERGKKNKLPRKKRKKPNETKIRGTPDDGCFCKGGSFD